MNRRAYISVYDKSGIEDFARNLVEKFDYEIFSTGSTLELLRKDGITVSDIADLSNGSDIYTDLAKAVENGNITGILSEDDEEVIKIDEFTQKNFDMVVINLEPFEKVALTTDNIDEMMKKIDLINIALLRAGAKNYKEVTVICDKIDYYIALNANEFGRLKLAAKALAITSSYDRTVSSKISEYTGDEVHKSISLQKIKELEYGENPHQRATIYKADDIVDYEVLFGNELSYNDVLNITEVTNIVSEFYDVNAVAIARHDIPCGVALGRTIYDAYTKAFDCDPISCFYGTFGFSKPVDADVAKHINSMSVSAIIAPDYDKEALEILKENTEVKIVKLNIPLKEYRKATSEEVTVTPFGTLIQDSNTSELDKDLFKVVTKTKPTAEQIEDAIFAWKVVKHAKTNAAIVVRDFKTVGISQGNANSIEAIESALNFACDNSKGAVIASDDAIPAEDCIYAAAQSRISLIIQPGGSVKDQKLIQICDEFGVSMITTGIRNFRH